MSKTLFSKKPLFNDAVCEGPKGCTLNIFHIDSSLVNRTSLCMYRRRTRHRITPYYTPGGRLVLVENDVVRERTHTKSENSDTGNENEDVKDCASFVSSLGLFKSKSLENINISSHNINFPPDLEWLQNRKNAAETPDVEVVSSKLECLNV